MELFYAVLECDVGSNGGDTAAQDEIFDKFARSLRAVVKLNGVAMGAARDRLSDLSRAKTLEPCAAVNSKQSCYCLRDR